MKLILSTLKINSFYCYKMKTQTNFTYFLKLKIKSTNLKILIVNPNLIKEKNIYTKNVF